VSLILVIGCFREEEEDDDEHFPHPEGKKIFKKIKIIIHF